jgi:hypothetical protein
MGVRPYSLDGSQLSLLGVAVVKVGVGKMLRKRCARDALQTRRRLGLVLSSRIMRWATTLPSFHTDRSNGACAVTFLSICPVLQLESVAPA